MPDPLPYPGGVAGRPYEVRAPGLKPGVVIVVEVQPDVARSGSAASVASHPNVCKTPAPGGPQPIPYPNGAAVAGDMKRLGLKSGFKGIIVMKTSTGDEAGTVGGVISSATTRAARRVAFEIAGAGFSAARFVVVEGRSAAEVPTPAVANTAR